MDGLTALTIVITIVAIGNIVSIKTKTLLPMMLVASVLFLGGFWSGILPKTIINDSQLPGISRLLIAFLITHLGTLLNFDDLKKQWKTVLIATGGVIGIGLFLFTVGSLVVGKEYAIAAAPPISGGIVAAVIMGDAAKEQGLEFLAVFTTLVLVFQGYFGYPLTSFLLRKEAKRVLKDRAESNLYDSTVELEVENNDSNEPVKIKKKLIPPLPDKYQTNYILLAKVGMVAVLGFKIADLTNHVVNANIICLLLGVLACELGLLEENIMVKANSFGFAILGLMAIAYGNLANASPEIVLSLLWPIFACLTCGVIGIVLFSGTIGKLLGFTKEMSISVGLTALFGFPGTFILSNEVAGAIGKTKEEEQVILDAILPKMLVAGFVTVTISSVLLAGFMSKLL